MSEADKQPNTSSADTGPDLDDTPPLLGSWRNIYIVVLGNLVLLIVLFWLLTAAYT